jgi:hypothetical protein
MTRRGRSGVTVVTEAAAYQGERSVDMPTETQPASEARPGPVRHRRATLIIVRSLLVSGVVVVGYFILPFTGRMAMDTVIELLAGLAVITVLLVWQIRGILRSPIPAVEAVATIAITVPMFLILFSTTYYLTSEADPTRFSQPLTRLDALYFTVTTFATVGFGDITATSETGRAVVTVQMVLGLVLVGLIARVLVGAVQAAKSRQGAHHPK